MVSIDWIFLCIYLLPSIHKSCPGISVLNHATNACLAQSACYMNLFKNVFCQIKKVLTNKKHFGLAKPASTEALIHYKKV